MEAAKAYKRGRRGNEYVTMLSSAALPTIDGYELIEFEAVEISGLNVY